MSNVKQVSSGSEVDERLAALLTNANAVRAIASAVEGTIGPKGLDTMLVDRFGEVVITNDGITILTRMDVNHPAARMVINTARAQEDEVGDGTTTATIMAGALLGEGVNQVAKGVPVTRVIDGVRWGVRTAIELIKKKSIKVDGLDDPVLRRVALIAGRDHEDIADLVVGAARMIGPEKLLEPQFKLADTVLAEEGAENEVFLGVIIDKERLNKQMPRTIEDARILIVDDALEPEQIEDEALSTEAGFARYMELQEDFRTNLRKLVALGVKVILVDRGVEDIAEEILTDAGSIVLSRVSSRELRKAAEHTGARMVKRTALRKEPAEIERYLGRAERVYEDERLEQVRIVGGRGKPMATILVGAATEEVVGERERIAKDAASSVQAAVKGGVVPGGGAIEMAVGRELGRRRDEVKGMSVYGLDCVIEALKKPLAQIVGNAGFNPLEKVGDVVAAQAKRKRDSLAVDCDTGEIADMLERGVIDPALVKVQALKAAGEIAEAILRIDTIIKMREQKPDSRGSAGPSGPGSEDLTKSF
ncbi:MAG TPA: TCP-1/cpn60 chaperonin family protein [Bacillota bacterium]|jgi:chaperonin GroEL (HSP60 family)